MIERTTSPDNLDNTIFNYILKKKKKKVEKKEELKKLKFSTEIKFIAAVRVTRISTLY